MDESKPELCPDCQWGGCRGARNAFASFERFMCHERTIARLKAHVYDLEGETMTLTSERDTARMGRDEWRARAEGVLAELVQFRRAALLRMADDE